MKKILSIVGARPNFMKVAPVHRQLAKDNYFQSKIVHTGQHYDKKMSKVFFDQLELPNPDYYLGAKGETSSGLTTSIMMLFESVLRKENPDLVLVVGDVTSTLACTIVAVQNKIKVAHVEAGLRSFDRNMPEEINRVLTDSVADYLFVSEYDGLVNLAKEGIPATKIFYSGNCMIDSIIHYKEKIEQINIFELFKVIPHEYIIVTMHRPSNVDTKEGLEKIVSILEQLAAMKKMVFPLHPRTRNNLIQKGLIGRLEAIENILITEPLGYLEFMALLKNTYCALTDSGGIQEETTFLGIPCITFRSNTERPITCDIGTNYLLKELDVEKTVNKVKSLDKMNNRTKHTVPPFWDGKAAERIVAVLREQL